MQGMKQNEKKYVTPDVEEVVYEMDSNIAGSCGLVSNNPTSYNDCIYDDNGVIFFMGQRCEGQADESLICYHVPTATTIVFSS
jgi:hypothetical protein